MVFTVPPLKDLRNISGYDVVPFLCSKVFTEPPDLQNKMQIDSDIQTRWPLLHRLTSSTFWGINFLFLTLHSPEHTSCGENLGLSLESLPLRVHLQKSYLSVSGWNCACSFTSLALYHSFFFTVCHTLIDYKPSEQGLYPLTYLFPSEWINEATPSYPSQKWVVPSVSLT